MTFPAIINVNRREGGREGGEEEEEERGWGGGLGAVSADDVTDGRPADGAQPLGGVAGPAVQLDGALVTEAHVAAGVEDAIDAPLVAHGALASGRGAFRQRQRLHVRRRAGR